MKKRDFIKTASLALGATVLPLSTWSCENPESILRTAHIGVSNMGLEDLKAIASHANVVVTALCDVDSNALKFSKIIGQCSIKFQNKLML
jgi:hypothetical protein